MRTRTLALVATIVAIGVVVTTMILRTEPSPTAGSEGGAEGGALSYPRGPHGARLLSDGDLQVEMTIYETGVPPQFRVYAYDGATRPVSPNEVSLQVELHRLGGRVDRMTFTPEADYLRSNEVVEEPHSFDVKVMASRAGKSHAWSYAQIEGKVQLGADQQKSAGITIETVGPREMVTTLELPGEVKTDETRVAHVVPRLQGVIEAVLKKEGDRVRRNEVIAVLNSRELADAKRDYIESEHQVEFTKTVLDREEMLWKKKISAEQDYLAAKKVAEEAVLAQKLAGQKLIVLGVPASSLAGLSTAPAEALARYELLAPIDGTVIERNVAVGEAVAADEDIFAVADLSAIWVDISVPAKELGAVAEGQRVTILSGDLSAEIDGRISYIGPLVGQDTRMATARIVLPNQGGKWRPGLFVTARLVRETVRVQLAVVAEAIQTFRDWQVVFVRYGDWFEARPLELGRTDGKYVEVLAGLKPGEQYAATNSFAVKAEIGKLGATHDH